MIGYLSLALPLLVQGRTIAVFPAGDKSGERDPAFSSLMVSETRKFLETKVSTHSLTPCPDAQVDEVLAKAKFVPSDREGWTTANLVELGQRIHCEFVLFSVVTETFNGSSNSAFAIGGGATGAAKVKVWLIDVGSQKAIVKGIVTEGKSSSNALGDLSGSKGRINRAVQLALGKALDDPLKTLDPKGDS